MSSRPRSSLASDQGRILQPDAGRSLLFGHDPQNAQEQVNDVQVQRSGTVNRVVDGALDLVGTPPIYADVAAKIIVWEWDMDTASNA